MNMRACNSRFNRCKPDIWRQLSPFFRGQKWGRFYIHIYSSYPSYLFHIINTDKTYPPVSLLPLFLYIPCHFIYSLPVFSRLPIPLFSFPPHPSVVSFSVSPHVAWDCLSFFPFFVSSGVPLVGSFRSVPFRSVPSLALFFVSVSRLVRVGSWGGAPFFSARFLVPSCLAVAFVSPGGGRCCPPSRFVVSLGRVVSPVVLSVDQFGVSGFLRLVRSSRVIVSYGVSFHPIVLVASSVLPCSGPCLIEREHPCLVPPWVSGASCRRLFCSHSRRSLARRRFPKLRFLSEISVDCPGSSCGMAWPSSSPLRSRPSLIALRSRRLASASRSSVRFVSPVGRPVFSHRARASSASSGFSFTWRFRSSLSIRAVFLSSIFHRLLITIVVVGIRANRLTGHRVRVVSYGTSMGTQLATPTRQERRNDGERRMTRMKTTTETTGARHERRRRQ